MKIKFGRNPTNKRNPYFYEIDKQINFSANSFIDLNLFKSYENYNEFNQFIDSIHNYTEVVVHIRMDRELHNRIIEYCNKNDTNISQFTRNLIRDKLKKA